jgi:DNA-binding LacI/PurR family transcriptional regulator
MPEIRQQDIAKELGLSISTVSLALRNSPQVAEETRVLVLEAAKRLGYARPAAPEQRTEIKSIAYIGTAAARDAFYGEVLSGAEAACRQRNIVMHYSRVEELNPWALSQYKEADGLLLVGSIDPEEVILKLKELGRPMVLVDNRLPQLDLDQVVTKNYDSLYRTVCKLWEWGHRQIAFICGPEDHPSFVERRQGYRAAAESLGMAPVEIHCHSLESLYVKQVLTEYLESVGRKPGFSALIAFHDAAAIETHHTLQDLGFRIPEEMALVGFDDIEMSQLVWPSLTTCHVERALLGRLGVELLLERINAPQAPSLTYAIDTTFIIRKSARPLDIE